jgi:uncharacterized protein
MVMSTDQILKQIKDSVYATDPGATLILYGSYARGDYDSESDIDILVLLDKDKITFDDRKRISYPLYNIELDIERHISPRIYTKTNWDNRLPVSPFYQNVRQDGILL